MILCDTGVIFAAISRADKNHQWALDLLSTYREPLVTTWPCITEAMYLLGKGGNRSQERLQQYLEGGVYQLHAPTFEDAIRACTLMRKYADTPMDFADASLVVAVEALNISRILTFDRHFYAYRINDTAAFEVLP